MSTIHPHQTLPDFVESLRVHHPLNETESYTVSSVYLPPKYPGSVPMDNLISSDHTLTFNFDSESNSIQYKFNEDEILSEIKAYIDSTYSQHYSQNRIQAAEFILDAGLGTGFCLGNVIKYATRYGKKNGHDLDDLRKIVHYAILAIHNHNQTQI